MAAATYRRELIEIQRTTRELMRELSVAKLQLAALINVDPASTFQLAAPGSTGFKLPSQQTSELVRIAAENRSELRDVAYRRRINMHEADAALLELLPGIQLYAGNNFDSNSYLLHDQWLNWGAKASWNLIKIFQYPARRDVIEAQNQLLDQRALALTMAIMTQVHVSRARLGHFQQELKIARDYETTQNKILHYVRAEHRAERVSTQTRLREELNALVGEARLNIARSAVESAKASLIASLGLDPHQPEAPTTTASTSSPRALVTASR
jgi:outer membrane protein TolC